MHVVMIDAIDEHSQAVVFSGLKEHNDAFAPRNQAYFTITLYAEDRIVGVAMGESKYDWVNLKYLWVDALIRGQGHGALLLRKTEELARSRKANGIYLDTFEFQARGFYEKYGYSVCGEIPEHPNGFKSFFMKQDARIAKAT